ncbi:major facilitator superfamily domain-containing protein [Ditylenchus destructor]|uniref:Major facilitator superfamily domain-containing protein n=1 Tax=Ditylenchus destructor TaxID=166010 RepID=A0AAD4N5H2_9BILA|nr:major facilitator superfamily domain-containing protein [Ditylenchus destructor]
MANGPKSSDEVIEGSHQSSEATTSSPSPPPSSTFSNCSSRKCLLNDKCVCCTPPSPAVFSTFCPCGISGCGSSPSSNQSSSSTNSMTSSVIAGHHKSKIFPSTRFFIAVLLCFCFISLSITTSNISVSMICMVRSRTALTEFGDLDISDFSALTPLEETNTPVINRAKIFTPKNDLTSSQKSLQSEIQRVKRSHQNVSSTSVFIEEIMRVLEKIGVDNATFRFHKQNRSENDNGTGKKVVSECQLARFRKHAPPDGKNTMDKVDANDGQIISNMGSKENGSISIIIEKCDDQGKMEWSSLDEGIVFAAQNVGSLLMLITGTQADRLNSKWTIVLSLSMLVLSNAILPIIAHFGVWYVVMARVLTGFSDALLQPATTSMLTRWFPPKERTFAIGLVTGGRQIGTLLIIPFGGFFCSSNIMGGWPAIFYLSALIGSVILIIWLFMSADKPSKHFCTSMNERLFVEQKIAEENLGKRKFRKPVPWGELRRCRPLYIGIAALICHEYPLVIMLQLLPSYFRDVLKLDSLSNGFISALAISALFIFKTLSSSLSSFIGARKKGRFVIGRTPLVKIFNGIASLGLGISIGIVPILTYNNHRVLTIVVLCFANAFAGLHTPGVQTALLHLAPAYTGVITGIAFGLVAICGIINKIFSTYIVKSGSQEEWAIVLWIAALVALMPVFFFTMWGSAERQPWATHHKNPDVSQSDSKAKQPGCCTIFNPTKIYIGGNSAAVQMNNSYQLEDRSPQNSEELDHDDTNAETFASALRFHMLDDQDLEEIHDENSPGKLVESRKIVQTF